MNDLAKCPFVFADGPRARCGQRPAGTIRTTSIRARRRITASIADRRRNGPNRVPTAYADATVRGLVQKNVTHRTRWREERRDKRVPHPRDYGFGIRDWARHSHVANRCRRLNVAPMTAPGRAAFCRWGRGARCPCSKADPVPTFCDGSARRACPLPRVSRANTTRD